MTIFTPEFFLAFNWRQLPAANKDGIVYDEYREHTVENGCIAPTIFLTPAHIAYEHKTEEGSCVYVYRATGTVDGFPTHMVPYCVFEGSRKGGVRRFRLRGDEKGGHSGLLGAAVHIWWEVILAEEKFARSIGIKV